MALTDIAIRNAKPRDKQYKSAATRKLQQHGVSLQMTGAQSRRFTICAQKRAVRKRF